VGPDDDDRDAVHVLEELLNEKDLFRLVIRGFALISDELDKAIANAFGGFIPDELNRLRLPARLALAHALGAVTPGLGAAIQRLGKVRHRLAHTASGEATDAEIRGLTDANGSSRRRKPRPRSASTSRRSIGPSIAASSRS
jgi:hypothetical protein